MTASTLTAAVGDRLGPLVVHVDRAQLVRYAGASGDFNPIHWNQRIATTVGLDDVIAHGMLTMALAGRLVSDWAGDPGRIQSFEARFTRPVVVPDPDGVDVTLTGTVAAIDDGAVRVDVEATVDGRKVLGRVRAVVKVDEVR